MYVYAHMHVYACVHRHLYIICVCLGMRMPVSVLVCMCVGIHVCLYVGDLGRLDPGPWNENKNINYSALVILLYFFLQAVYFRGGPEAFPFYQKK